MLNRELYDLGANLAYRLTKSSMFDLEALNELKPITIKSISGRPFHFDGAKSCFPNSIYEHFKSAMEQGRTQSILEANCQIFRSAYDLPIESVKLLAFIALNSFSSPFNEYIETQLGLSQNHLYQLISDALDIDFLTLKHTLEMLSKTGLWEEYSVNADDMLQMHPYFAKSLAFKPSKDFSQLLSHVISKLPKSTLKIDNYSHLDMDILNDLVESTDEKGLQGINILFYGEPGVGKTELARLIIDQINANLFEVKALGESIVNPHDELNSRYSSAQLRLQYLRMTQRLFSGKAGNWLLIDECEDVYSSFHHGTKVSKDLFHELLETNSTPTIWITNNPELIPPSCIRRFSYVLELPNLPDDARQDLLDKSLKGLRVSKEFKSRLLTVRDLTPAILNKGRELCKACDVQGVKAEVYIESYLEQSLQVQGRPFWGLNNYRAEIEFDPEFCNVKGDVSSLLEVIRAVDNFNEARVLLYGASGTGKSAFVHYVCKELSINLLTVKASDLLGKYVGESEKNIARYFELATKEGKALLLDEADSLLSTREGATRPWEVSQVNELLMQIERFQSPLFVATNYFERLDKALLRRMDFKVELLPLTPKQSIEVFKKVVGEPPLNNEKARLESMVNLTMGDFALLSRRKRFKKGRVFVREALEILEMEHKYKLPKRRIGFNI